MNSNKPVEIKGPIELFCFGKSNVPHEAKNNETNINKLFFKIS
jgi:hypothetical protein